MNAYDLMSPPYDINISHDCGEVSMVIKFFLRPWLVVNNCLGDVSVKKAERNSCTL